MSNLGDGVILKTNQRQPEGSGGLVARLHLSLQGARLPGSAAVLLAAAMALMPSAGRGQDEGAPRSEFGLRLGDLASVAWGIDDGLPSDEVFDLLQTRDGYLWVATAGGLARFDGIRFEVFDRANTPGLKSDRILTLYESRDGTLWAGSEGGGLTAFHPGRQRRAEPIEELAELTVRALMEDRDGVLWAATSAGAWRSQGQGGSFERVEVGLREVTAMAEDARGTLWLGGPEGLVRREGDAFERPEYAQGIDAVQVMAVDDDDTLWLGTPRSLIHIRREGVTRFFDNVSIALLDRDSLGILWFASGSGTLARIHEGKPEPSRWSGAGVSCILRDREGSLWLGGRGEPQVLRQLRPPAPASIDNPSFCVLPSETDGVWLGSLHGVAWMPVGMGWRAVSADRYVIREATYALARGSEGSIWAGHRNGTISRWSKDGLETFLKPRAGAVASIQTIYEDHAGTLWIGYRNQGAARLEAKAGTLVPLPAFDELNVRWFQEMPGGEFFIGTSDGLFQDGVRVSDPLLDGLAEADFFAHHLDDDGNLWLTILGNGLCRWKDGRFSTWRRRVGFLKDNLLTVMTDHGGNLWMGTRRDVFYLAKRSLEDFDAGKIGKIEEIEYKSVAEGRGKVNRAGGYPLAARALDGSVWIVRQQDVLYLPPGMTLTKPHEPPVLVEHVLADGTALEGHGAVELRSGTRRLTIHYTAPTHAAPELAKFKYRLSGHTDDWIDAGTERVAQFTDLHPGKYGFQVIASNGQGVWNETGATIAIRILPRWFETWWFRVGSFIGAGILVAGFVRLRLAAAHRRNEALQREIGERQRTEAVLLDHQKRLKGLASELTVAEERERRRIAANLHDDVCQTLALARVQLSTARKTAATDAKQEARLDELSETIRKANTDTRHVVYDLSSPLLNELGLEEAIREWLEEEVRKRHGLETNFNTDGGTCPLGEDEKSLLFRSVRELLTNVVKHARAKRVTVEVAHQNESIQLVINDDGAGFNAEETQFRAGPEGGFGLFSIRERMENMGGGFALESEPGKGCRVVLTLPCCAAAGSDKAP